MRKLLIIIIFFIFFTNFAFSQNKFYIRADIGGQLTLNKNYPVLSSSYPVLNIGLQYRFTSDLSAITNAAIRKTENNIEFAYLTAGAKYSFYRHQNLLETFLQAGAGIYMSETVSAFTIYDGQYNEINRGKLFGLNLGGGIDCNIQNDFAIEFSIGYHIFNLNGNSKTSSFISPVLGFRKGF